MKQIFCSLVVASLLGAGCSSSVSAPKLNVVSSPSNIQTTSTQDFDLKLKCQPIIENFKRNLPEVTIENFLIESFSSGCYSKKFNTCIVFVQRSYNYSSPEKKYSVYDADDLLTLRTIEELNLSAGTAADPFNPLADGIKMASFESSMDCIR